MSSQSPPHEDTVAWSGRFLEVIRCGHWEYAHRIGATGAVVVVAITPARSLLLVEQYRIPVGRRVIEMPAGLVGDDAEVGPESMIEAAKRELLEETGFEAGELIELASGPPSAGLASEVATLVLATNLIRKGKGGGVQHEEITVHEIPLEEVDVWLMARQSEGAMVDPKIYAGLHLYGRWARQRAAG